MKIMSNIKFADKGDRLWWKVFKNSPNPNSEVKMTIPLGIAIYKGVHKEWKDVTIIHFYLLCFLLSIQIKK